ncbi:MAG TPA: hypothetical protein VGS20_08405 [Candidatus Acidoferrales bacterium]|nr:hypothetical protein [Candidatus Acidoferrales bacterium]
MSLLRNIWRPNDTPGKGPASPAESVLTERLAELLGRETGEDRETSAAASPDRPFAEASVSTEEGGGAEITAVARPTEEVSMEPVRSAPPAPPQRRVPMSIPPRPSAGPGGSIPSGKAVSSIARATEQALEQLKSAEQQIEAELRKHVDEYERTLEAAALAISERGTASEKPLEEAATRFRSEAREWFEGARRELRDQLEASRNSLEGELRKNHQELLESARQKIESLAHASLENTAQASRLAEQEQIGAWLKEQAETSRRQTERAARELAQATESALTRLRQVEEKLETTFRAQVEEYRQAVESAAAELERKGISQAKFQNAAIELQQATEQILERSAKRIEERTAQAVNTLGEKLAAAEQSLGSAARESLEAALIEQRERWAKLWQEQGRAAVDSVAQAAEAGQKQLEDARKAAEEGFENAAREHSRRLVEAAAAELKSDGFRQELIAETTAQIEQAAKESAARSAKELNKQKEATVAGLTGTLKQASQKFIEEVGDRLDAASRAWFESAGQTVQEEYRSRLAAWLEEQTQIARRQTEAASQTVSQMAVQAKSRLETIARDTEATFRGRAEEQQRQWIETALEKARASGLEQKVVDRTLAELDKSAARFLEQSAEKLAQQAENSRNAIAARMDEAARKLLEGVEASLESISWQHRGRLGQWWEERQQAARRESESHGESIARAAQQAATQLKSTQQEIEQELKSRSREHQMRLLDSAMEELRGSGAIDRVVTEATGALRTNTNDILSRSNEQLREQVETSRLALENQAQASRRGMAEELARITEQAQASVEGAGKAVTEDYRRQLSVWWEERTQSARKESEEAAGGITRSARQASEQLLTMQKEMENELRIGLENYRKGLREAAAEEIRRQGFQKEALETITTELDNCARELAARSTRELQQHIHAALAGLDDKAKATRQAFLEDTQKKLGDLTQASMDTAGSRFHEFMVKNVKELEHEQEGWLQRKREGIWLDINKASAPSSPTHSTPLQRTLLREEEPEMKQEAAASSALSWVLTVFAVIAMAGALTAVFVRMTPQKVISMQLRNQAPNGWVTVNAAWSAKRRSHELQLAQAYWMIAVNDLQHRYAFNTELPPNPPPEFKVDTADLKDDAATRTHYWDEMRVLWTNPDTWQQTVSNQGGQAARAIDWLRQKFFATAEKTAQSAGQ